MHSFVMQYALFVCSCTFIYAWCIFVWEEFFKILSLYHSKGGCSFSGGEAIEKTLRCPYVRPVTLKGKISKWYLPKFLFISKFFHSLVFYYALFLCFLHSFAELIFVFCANSISAFAFAIRDQHFVNSRN